MQIPDSDDDNKPAVVENKDHSVLDIVIPQSIAPEITTTATSTLEETELAYRGKSKAARKPSATKTKVKSAKTKATKTKTQTKVLKSSNE